MNTGTPRVAIGVASLNSPYNLARCINLVMGQRPEPEYVSIVQNGSRVAEACRRLGERYPVTIVTPGRNLGTCAAWNLLALMHLDKADAILLLGDDVFLTDLGTVGKVKAAVIEGPGALWFLETVGFSGVAITRKVWGHIGGFDEGFWPAYFEDNDYQRRAALLQVPSSDIKVDGVEHIGSGSLRVDPVWQSDNARIFFPLNRLRYLRKWGGLPGQEQYSVPWGGGSPVPSTRDIARSLGAYGIAAVERKERQ